MLWDRVHSPARQLDLHHLHLTKADKRSIPIKFNRSWDLFGKGKIMTSGVIHVIFSHQPTIDRLCSDLRSHIRLEGKELYHRSPNIAVECYKAQPGENSPDWSSRSLASVFLIPRLTKLDASKYAALNLVKSLGSTASTLTPSQLSNAHLDSALISILSVATSAPDLACERLARRIHG